MYLAFGRQGDAGHTDTAWFIDIAEPIRDGSMAARHAEMK